MKLTKKVLALCLSLLLVLPMSLPALAEDEVQEPGQSERQLQPKRQARAASAGRAGCTRCENHVGDPSVSKRGLACASARRRRW